MTQKTRREFLRDTTLVAAGTAAAASALGGVPLAGSVPKRVLGRTGERVSIIGYGLAPLGSDGSTPEHVTRTLTHALEQGVNYFDVAPVYGNDDQRYGNAETKMRSFLKAHRKDIYLVSKANASQQDRAGMQRQVEKSLQRLGIEHLDLVHIHNLGDFDMERLFAEDGALAGLREAKKRGLIRHIGVSGHSRPNRFARLIETGEIDVTMVALNFADRNNYNFEELVLPAARKQGTAVAAMKVLGGTVGWKYDGETQAHFADYHQRAIRYVLGLPGVVLAVIGFNNAAEVDMALQVARSYKPLSAAERADLLEAGKRLAQSRASHYGPTTG